MKGGRAAGRRVLLSIDDTVPEGAQVIGVSQFEFMGSDLQWAGLVLVAVLVLVCVAFALSGWYDATRRPRHRGLPSRASPSKSTIYDVWGLIWSCGSARVDEKML